MSSSNSTLVVNCTETLEQFSRAVSQARLVACDCEGVDLSRFGSVTLVSFAIPVASPDATTRQTFLIDVQEFAASIPVIKGILEDNLVEKVIHDCRQDSDALHAKFGITLTNVSQKR